MGNQSTRQTATSTEMVRVGAYRVHLDTREVFRGEQLLQLPWRSFEALQILIETKGEVVERDTFFARLWTGVTVGESNLNQSTSLPAARPSRPTVSQRNACRGSRRAGVSPPLHREVAERLGGTVRRGCDRNLARRGYRLAEASQAEAPDAENRDAIQESSMGNRAGRTLPLAAAGWERPRFRANGSSVW